MMNTMAGKLEQVIMKTEANTLQFQLEHELWVAAMDSKLQKKSNKLKLALRSWKPYDRSSENSN